MIGKYADNYADKKNIHKWLGIRNNCYICKDDSVANDYRFVAGRRNMQMFL